MSVFDFWSVKPDVRGGFDHSSLDHPQQPTMHLSNLRAKFKNTAHLKYSDKCWCITQTQRNKMLYQRVAAITGQDDHVNGCRVIGHTYTTIIWFVFSADKTYRHSTK